MMELSQRFIVNFFQCSRPPRYCYLFILQMIYWTYFQLCILTSLMCTSIYSAPWTRTELGTHHQHPHHRQRHHHLKVEMILRVLMRKCSCYLQIWHFEKYWKYFLFSSSIGTYNGPIQLVFLMMGNWRGSK